MPGVERASRPGVTVDTAAILGSLRDGAIEVVGLLPFASNYTFLARVTHGNGEIHAVYKPQRGERPLWDFPHGTLEAREVAAFETAAAAEWDLVPPTVLRSEAPLGPGSLQLFIEHDPERHYLVIREERREELAVFAAFDAVINNADRKSGHVLEGSDGHLWAVDHGVTFHTDPKLRTVIWEFAGERLPDAIRPGLLALRSELDPERGLGRRLCDLLTEEERAATMARVEDLLAAGSFPQPNTDRPYPWPLV